MIRRFLTTPFGVNLYVYYDPKTLDGIIIDPGGYPVALPAFLERTGITLRGVVLTHGHGDHFLGLDQLLGRFQIPVMGSKKDDRLFADGDLNFSTRMTGQAVTPTLTRYLAEGDRIEVGNLTLEVIHTPGHSPGGICLKGEDVLFTGDTLFRGSIGRTDLYRGNEAELLRAINQKLMVLDEDLRVCPGHGDESTIGVEKRENPFLRGADA